MAYRRYIASLAFFTLAIFAAGSVFIYFIDPYGIFGSPRIENFNARKPTAENRVRISKPLQVENIKPTTLIIGNSRPEMGLDPGHSCWKEHEKPVYSLTIPGSSVYMQSRLLAHATHFSEIETVLMGLDFLDFTVSPSNDSNPYRWPPTDNSFDSNLSISTDNTPNNLYTLNKYKTYLKSIVSLDTLTDSIITLSQQQNITTTHRTHLGFNPAEAYYTNIINNEGVEVLFKQKNNELRKRLSSKKWSIYNKNTQWSSSFESLRRAIKLTKDKNIKLLIFINPYHNDYLDIIESTGHWKIFNEWKNNIQKLTKNENHVILWDFAERTEFSAEAIDTFNPKKPLQWFWEPAHYKKELGNILLAKMMSFPCFSN